MRGLRALQHHLAAEIFALGDVDHFLGDDPGAGPFELGEGFFPSPLWGGARGGGREMTCGRRRLRLRSRRCLRLRPTLPHKGGGSDRPQRLRRIRKTPRQMLAADVAVVDRLDGAALVFLDAAAFAHPGGAPARQAALDVDHSVGIGVGPGRIVDRHRRLAGGRIKHDLAQRHFQVGRGVGLRKDLARAGDRAGRDLRRGQIGFGEVLVHDFYSFSLTVICSTGIPSRSERRRRRSG